MKLATFTSAENETPRVALVQPENARLIDLARLDSAINGKSHPCLASMLDLVCAHWDGLDHIESLMQHCEDSAAYVLPLGQVRLLPPLPNPPHIRCYSAYAGHFQRMMDVRLKARWGGWAVWLNRFLPLARVPKAFFERPVGYRANPLCIAGPNDDLRLPDGAHVLDYEMELGMIIGQGGVDIAVDDAMDHIFGYTIYNDVTARDVLAAELSNPAGGLPDKGKNFAGSHVIGPWIVTADEMEDPYCRAVTVRINGVERARGDTDGLTHSVADIIAEASRNEPLLAGEFIGTGATEFGTGLEVGVLPKPGDKIEIEIDGIGTLTNLWRAD